MDTPRPSLHPWYGLLIGNSRLHWAEFDGAALIATVNTPHWPIGEESTAPPMACCPNSWPQTANPELWVASVVPPQTAMWQTYGQQCGQVRLVTIADVPLANIYPSFGIDRALALWGAGERYGWPVLVLDGGTALTLTGADAGRQLIGGAILPGLASQLASLHQKTAALPQVELPLTLPDRWALTTLEAISSGIVYTVLAGMHQFIRDWWQRFPQSAVVFTGGDGDRLLDYFQQSDPPFAARLIGDPHLGFWGLAAIRHRS